MEARVWRLEGWKLGLRGWTWPLSYLRFEKRNKSFYFGFWKI